MLKSHVDVSRNELYTNYFLKKVSATSTLFCYSENTVLFSAFNAFKFETLIACIACAEMLVTSLNRLSIEYGLEPLIVCLVCS